jgi:hypothetical protein
MQLQGEFISEIIPSLKFEVKESGAANKDNKEYNLIMKRQKGRKRKHI